MKKISSVSYSASPAGEGYYDAHLIFEDGTRSSLTADFSTVIYISEALMTGRVLARNQAAAEEHLQQTLKVDGYSLLELMERACVKINAQDSTVALHRKEYGAACAKIRNLTAELESAKSAVAELQALVDRRDKLCDYKQKRLDSVLEKLADATGTETATTEEAARNVVEALADARAQVANLKDENKSLRSGSAQSRLDKTRDALNKAFGSSFATTEGAVDYAVEYKARYQCETEALRCQLAHQKLTTDNVTRCNDIQAQSLKAWQEVYAFVDERLPARDPGLLVDLTGDDARALDLLNTWDARIKADTTLLEMWNIFGQFSHAQIEALNTRLRNIEANCQTTEPLRFPSL